MDSQVHGSDVLSPPVEEEEEDVEVEEEEGGEGEGGGERRFGGYKVKSKVN
jgi:hypothetical protein